MGVGHCNECLFSDANADANPNTHAHSDADTYANSNQYCGKYFLLFEPGAWAGAKCDALRDR